MRKLILLVAALAATALSAGNAMAFDNITVGDTVAGVNTTAISFGSFMSCNNSTFSGQVTTDNGTDAGGAASITSATFTNCVDGSGTATVTATGLPWTLTIDGSGSATLSGIDIDIRTGSGATCHYTGSLSLQYDAADWGGNGDAPLSGSLTLISGTSLACTMTMAIAGTYNITGPNGVIDL